MRHTRDRSGSAADEPDDVLATGTDPATMSAKWRHAAAGNNPII